MPFILAGPGIPKGKRNDALFNMQSLFATTCEMARVPVPASVGFPSIVPLITGEKRELQPALYAAFLNRQRAVRTTEWKLIRTPAQHRVQLFAINKDPWEMHNLANDQKYAETLNSLNAQLRALMVQMKDPMPTEKVFWE
jgi:choline-sulfatase